MSATKLLILISASIIILLARFFTFYQAFPRYVDGQEISLQVVLQEEPDISIRGQKFSVKNKVNQRIYILSSLNTLYHYGDQLAISGKLQVKKNDKGVTFLTLNFPKIAVVPGSKNVFVEAALGVRENSLRLFQATLPQTSSSLLAGIVFGAKENFPDQFLQQLRTTGVLHVIAASGMNVSFFTGAVMFSLGVVLKRRIALFLSIIAVIFYSFLVGFEASILRASIMAIIALTASFFGRQNLALLTLMGTGMVMLLWQPAYLFDVGFQLSFMATLGILLVKPALKQVEKVPLIGEDLTTTLSAQVGTLPILLGTFGSVGVLSLVVNVLVLWTVPILMVLGALGVMGGLLVPVLGKSFLLFCLPFLFFFEQVISYFGSMGLVLQIDGLPWEIGVGYYLLLGAVIMVAHKR